VVAMRWCGGWSAEHASTSGAQGHQEARSLAATLHRHALALIELPPPSRASSDVHPSALVDSTHASAMATRTLRAAQSGGATLYSSRVRDKPRQAGDGWLGLGSQICVVATCAFADWAVHSSLVLAGEVRVAGDGRVDI
jgi:hypothetical protein